jgi:hypothetical protein
MWPTLDGLRVLKGDEAGLVCASIGVMVDRLAIEIHNDAEPHPHGIDWFDQWDGEQKLWLLEQITLSLLTTASAPPPAAIWDATIDTVFCQVIEQIEYEIDSTAIAGDHRSWRQRVIDAFQCQRGRAPKIDLDEIAIDQWRKVATQISDAILGVTCYQQAESFRDGDFERSSRFLIGKGMPEDYLERIPPLRTAAQAEESIDRIRAIVGAS